jgi:hypothetical protein
MGTSYKMFDIEIRVSIERQRFQCTPDLCVWGVRSSSGMGAWVLRARGGAAGPRASALPPTPSRLYQWRHPEMIEPINQHLAPTVCMAHDGGRPW